MVRDALAAPPAVAARPIPAGAPATVNVQLPVGQVYGRFWLVIAAPKVVVNGAVSPVTVGAA